MPRYIGFGPNAQRWGWVFAGLCLLLSCRGDGLIPDDAETRFFRVFGRIDDSQAGAMLPTESGGFFLAGTLTTSTEENLQTVLDQQVYLIHSDARGNLISSTIWGQPGRDEELITAVSAPGQGYALLVNLTSRDSLTQTRPAWYLVDEEGNTLDSTVWAAGSQQFIGEDMIRMDNGGYALLITTDSLASTNASSNQSDLILWLLNSEGSPASNPVLFLKGGTEYNPLESQIRQDKGVALTQLSSEALVVLGTAYGSEIVVLRVDLPNPLANSQYKQIPGSGEALTARALLRWPDDDHILIAYTAQSDDSVSTRLLALNEWLQPQGTPQVVNPEGIARLRGIAMDRLTDGGVILAADAFGVGVETDLALVRLSSALSPTWVRRFGDVEVDATAQVLALTPPDYQPGFALLGTLGFGPNDMITLIRTDSLGNLD